MAIVQSTLVQRQHLFPKRTCGPQHIPTARNMDDRLPGDWANSGLDGLLVLNPRGFNHWIFPVLSAKEPLWISWMRQGCQGGQSRSVLTAVARCQLPKPQDQWNGLGVVKWSRKWIVNDEALLTQPTAWKKSWLQFACNTDQHNRTKTSVEMPLLKNPWPFVH